MGADGSGLIPSDLDGERGLMGWLIVNPHCSDLTLRDLVGFSGSRVNRVLTARSEKGRSRWA